MHAECRTSAKRSGVGVETEKDGTVERVLLNPSNGKIAVGFRLRFMDKYHGEDIGGFDGKYNLKIEPTNCDAWAIDNEQGIYVVVHESLLKDIEDLGPL